MTNDKKWRMILAWLRRNFKPPLPVTVRRVRGYKAKSGCFGECLLYDDCIEINVERSQSFSLQCDTIIHEWAHALTLGGNDDDEHGCHWGLAYARIYRLFIEWNYGRPRSNEE